MMETIKLNTTIATNGWHLGYFEATYGALADDPIERPEQLPLEERDLIE